MAVLSLISPPQLCKKGSYGGVILTEFIILLIFAVVRFGMLQYELIGQSSGSFYAHHGQARYPLGASTLLIRGKHRAQFQYCCSPRQ